MILESKNSGDSSTSVFLGLLLVNN